MPARVHLTLRVDTVAPSASEDRVNVTLLSGEDHLGELSLSVVEFQLMGAALLLGERFLRISSTPSHSHLSVTIDDAVLVEYLDASAGITDEDRASAKAYAQGFASSVAEDASQTAGAIAYADAYQQAYDEAYSGYLAEVKSRAEADSSNA